MKKESDMNQIAQFMAGAQDMSVFHQDTADGFMNLTAYYILPGIYLTLNDIHTQVVPSTHAELTPDILLINYCMEGRCEFRIDEDNYSYLDNRLMNTLKRFRIISTTLLPFTKGMKSIFFPTGSRTKPWIYCVCSGST